MERLPGFRDFYPEPLPHKDVWSADARQYIFGKWRELARRYGFREYDGPPLEPLELFTTKSGDEIVGQLYNFKDKGDREIALRPEMTPTLRRRQRLSRSCTVPAERSAGISSRAMSFRISTGRLISASVSVSELRVLAVAGDRDRGADSGRSRAPCRPRAGIPSPSRSSRRSSRSGSGFERGSGHGSVAA